MPGPELIDPRGGNHPACRFRYLVRRRTTRLESSPQIGCVCLNIHADKIITEVIAAQAPNASRNVHAYLMDATIRKILAANIFRLRTDNNWSQTTLAKKSGVVQSAISYLEKAEGKSPTLDTIEGLATAFGVPSWTLLVPTDNMPPDKIREMSHVVSTYTLLPANGQQQVARIAEAEARYAKAS